MPDKRIKGCINKECSAYRKIKYKSNDEYCLKCGSKLAFVCSKCWTPLASDSPKIRICAKCKAKAADRKEMLIKTGKGLMTAVPGLAVAVVKNIKK